MFRENASAPDSSPLSSTTTSSRSDQLRAAERLANYPRRVERLKRLWIDIDGGGQFFNGGSRHSLGSGTPTRRPSTPTRRSVSPRERASPREPSAPRQLAQQQASPPPVREPPSPAPRRPSPTSPCVSRPRQSRRTPSPARVARDVSPARGPRHAPAAPKRAPGRGRAGHRGAGAAPTGGPLTRRQIEELMSRDLTPEDYELLCMLDEGVKKVSLLSLEAAAALPRATGTDWINEECRICLCALEEDEDVRMLPTCGHLFHAPCAERWLSTSKNTCPLCGQQEAVQEKVVNAFGRFDTNNDGLVHMNEMKTVLFKLDPKAWTDETVSTLFRSLDVDQDGKISTKEFVDWIFQGSASGEQQMLRGTLHI